MQNLKKKHTQNRFIDIENKQMFAGGKGLGGLVKTKGEGKSGTNFF